MFKVGDATITRVEETNLPSYPLRDIFPAFSDAHMAEHKHWLAPLTFCPDSADSTIWRWRARFPWRTPGVLDSAPIVRPDSLLSLACALTTSNSLPIGGIRWRSFQIASLLTRPGFEY